MESDGTGPQSRFESHGVVVARRIDRRLPKDRRPERRDGWNERDVNGPAGQKGGWQRGGETEDG